MDTDTYTQILSSIIVELRELPGQAARPSESSALGRPQVLPPCSHAAPGAGDRAASGPGLGRSRWLGSIFGSLSALAVARSSRHRSRGDTVVPALHEGAPLPLIAWFFLFSGHRTAQRLQSPTYTLAIAHCWVYPR